MELLRTIRTHNLGMFLEMHSLLSALLLSVTNTVIAQESFIKEKLGSRAFGLNVN